MTRLNLFKNRQRSKTRPVMKKRRKNRTRKSSRTNRARRSTKRTAVRRTRRARRVSRRRASVFKARRKRRVIASAPARRSRPRRRTIRRGSRRIQRYGGGLTGGIRGFVNKDMLILAGGAVGSVFITNWVLSKYGPIKTVSGVRVPRAAEEFVLPGLRLGTDGKGSPIAAILYSVGIPLAAAYALRKVSPAIAKGIALGGLINGLKEGVAIAIANKAISAASAAQPPVKAYLSRRQLGVGYGAPSAQAMNTVGASPYQSNNAYPQAAFSN